jgi:hypothetical protein
MTLPHSIDYRLFAAAMAVALAAAPAAEPPLNQQKAWADRAERLAVAEAQSYDIRLGRSGGSRLALVETPALKWSNTDDATIHGSVLVWTHEGRPEAIASIFKFFTVKDEFSVELHSLSESPLVATKGGRTMWQPNDSGVTFSPLPSVASVAESTPARLVQMRGIARDFTGTMTTFAQTTHPLRLLAQPLVRYAGDKRRPVDGAIFGYVRATDPDVLLVLEARAADGGEAKWHYALARMHCGALTMKYEGRDVWSVEQMTHPFARADGVYSLLQGIPEPTIGAAVINP